MVSQLRTEPWAEDATVAERAESVVAAAVERLGLPLPDLTSAVLESQLDDLRKRLEQRIASSAEPTDDTVATAEILIAVLRLRCDLIDHDLVRRVSALSEIRNALGDLRGLSPREMIHAAPVVLSRELAFTRTMISTVRGSLWLPQRLHIAEETDRHSKRFREYVDGARIPLSVAALETELVRKRCGALVPAPLDDKRTFKEIVEVAGCFGYIVAPITVHGRAIGMLHADRPGSCGMVSMEHLDQLETFAECLSVAFESAVLEEKAAQQRTEVDKLCGNVDGLLSGSAQSAVRPAAGAHAGEFQLDHPAASSLTAREREIISHVATGATNGQIARALVISEGTVKSHLKRIAKKLNTPSRAAAVAVYSGMATADAGGVW